MSKIQGSDDFDVGAIGAGHTLNSLLTDLNGDPGLRRGVVEVLDQLRKRGLDDPLAKSGEREAKAMIAELDLMGRSTFRACRSAPTSGGAPTPADEFATFEDGTWMVGKDIKSGTYRATSPGGDCYWARLHDFKGGLHSILANGVPAGPVVVTILASDAGFETAGCGEWTSDLSSVTSSRSRFGDGVYLVGIDVAPGTYRAAHPSRSCYWARLRDLTGGQRSIIANGLPSGPGVVTLARSDEGIESTGCGDWVRI